MELNNTTEGIGAPLLQAMISLWESAMNLDTDDQTELYALYDIHSASNRIWAAFIEAVAPPSAHDMESPLFQSESDLLAFELSRSMDAYKACIDTMRKEAGAKRYEAVLERFEKLMSESESDLELT